MKKLCAFLVCFVFVGISALQAQNVQITGTVSSAEEGPLPGVSIVVKGTTIGTTTDGSGKYSFSIPANATVLTFSFMGYKTQDVAIEGRRVIDLVLQSDARELEEIIVIGYGVAKKSTFTGSATNVKTEKITGIPVTSIEKALKGNVPGLMSQNNSGQPGSQAAVIIRGIGSINAGTEPLYVIDGVPVLQGNLSQMRSSTATNTTQLYNTLSSLNPADIESITVLKDASATSIYGSRASNGVVLITTKRGKEGKAKVSFSQQTGFSSRANKHFKVLTTPEYLGLELESRLNVAQTTAVTDAFLNSLAVKEATITDLRNFDRYYNEDWMKWAYKDNALTQSWDLSVNGGNDKTQVFASASYFNQEGIVIRSNMERYSLRANITQKVSEKITFGLNSTLSYNRQESPLTTSAFFLSPVAGSVFTPPFNPAKNADGTWHDGPLGTGLIGNSGVNFAANHEYNDFWGKTYRALGTSYLQWEIIPGLVAKTNWGVDFQSLAEYGWDDQRSRGNTAYGVGRASQSQNNALTWTGTNTLSYSKSLLDQHNIDVLVGQEAQSYNLYELYAANETFASFSLRELASGARPTTAWGSQTNYTFLSYFGRANYNFMNKYYFSGSFRRDGSSRFGANNRWANFWSVGTSYRITEEEFMKGISFLNNLQLRASYGTSGNASISNFASLGLYSYDAVYGTLNASRPSQISNPDLTWEKNANYNIGVDVRLFDRVSATVEYYNRKTYDLLLSAPLSSTSGFTSTMKNIGEMVNKGWEVTLEGDALKFNNFVWSLEGNITFNQNKITKLYEGQEIPWGFQRLKEGMPINEFHLFQWAGVNPADGRPMWYDADGNIVFTYAEAGRLFSGNALPKFYGSYGSTISYDSPFGKFALTAQMYFQYGNKVYENNFRILNSDGSFANFNQHVNALNRWQKPGDITDVPMRRFSNTWQGNLQSTRWLLDGSYMRLRNVMLSYTLPKEWVSKVGMGSARIYWQGTNLWNTYYPGYDPEQGVSGDTWFQYPNARTVTFGVDLTF